MSVILINPFQIAPAQESAFVQSWKETAAVFAQKAGYLDTRLHRALDSSARFRFVNVAHWESAEAWSEAMKTFPPREKDMPGVEANPALYNLVEGGSPDPVKPSVEDDLRTIEQGLARAYQSADLDFLKRVFDESYIVTDGPGTVSDKAKLISDYATRRLQVSQFRFDEMQIRRLTVDTAVAMGQYTWSAAYDGHPISGSFRYLRVYVRGDHGWRIHAGQVTPVLQKSNH